MKTKDYLFFLVPISITVVPLNASAQLYRWVDESGRTMMTDTPPPPKVKVEKIGKAKSEEQKATITETSPVVKESKPDQNAQCAQSRRSLQLLESGQPLNFVNDKGERVAVDAPGRAAELARLKEFLKSCPN